MAEGQYFGVGFYAVDPKTGTPLRGPYYTREGALASYDQPGLSCCILEVVRQPQTWLDELEQVKPQEDPIIEAFGSSFDHAAVFQLPSAPIEEPDEIGRASCRERV